MKLNKNNPIWLPAFLFVYLVVIILYAGLPHFYAGNYLLFFGVSGGSLLVIVLLYLSLRYKAKLRKRREEEQYGRYADDPQDKAPSNQQDKADNPS